MGKKKSASKSSPAKQPNFEDALGELEKIVDELESGSLPLSQSIERYEKGVKLLRHCHVALGQVQQKIRQLTKVSESGDETTVPFEGDSDSENPADVDEKRQLF